MSNKVGFVPHGIDTPEDIELFLMRSISIPPTRLIETGSGLNPSYGPIPAQVEPSALNSDPDSFLGIEGNYHADQARKITIRIEEHGFRPVPNSNGAERPFVDYSLSRFSIKRDGVDANFIGVTQNFELTNEEDLIPDGSGWTDAELLDTVKFTKDAAGVQYAFALVRNPDDVGGTASIVAYKLDPYQDPTFSPLACLPGHSLQDFLGESFNMQVGAIDVIWMFNQIYILVASADEVCTFHVLRFRDNVFSVVTKNEVIPGHLGILDGGISLVEHPSGTGVLLAMGTLTRVEGEQDQRTILIAYSPDLRTWSKEDVGGTNIFATLPKTSRIFNPVGRNVTDIIFASDSKVESDSKFGWLCTDFGYIYHTTNGGSTWALQLNPAMKSRNLIATAFPLRKMYVRPSGTNIYSVMAVGDHGLILKSVDSGANWKVVRVGINDAPKNTIFSESDFLSDIEFSPTFNFGTGELGRNGWLNLNWTSIVMASLDKFYVGGENGWIVGSTDGGETMVKLWFPNHMVDSFSNVADCKLNAMYYDGSTLQICGKNLFKYSAQTTPGAKSARAAIVTLSNLDSLSANESESTHFELHFVTTDSDSDEMIDTRLRTYLTSKGKIYNLSQTTGHEETLLFDLRMQSASRLGKTGEKTWVTGTDMFGKTVVLTNYSSLLATADSPFVAAYLHGSAQGVWLFQDDTGYVGGNTLWAVDRKPQVNQAAYPKWHVTSKNKVLILGFSDLSNGSIAIQYSTEARSSSGIPELSIGQFWKAFPPLSVLEEDGSIDLPSDDLCRVSFSENMELGELYAHWGTQTRISADEGYTWNNTAQSQSSLPIGQLIANFDDYPISSLSMYRESTWFGGRAISVVKKGSNAKIGFFSALHWSINGSMYKPLIAHYPLWIEGNLFLSFPSSNFSDGDTWTIDVDYLTPPRHLVEESPSVSWRSRDYGIGNLHPEILIEWDRIHPDAVAELGDGQQWWNHCGDGIVRINAQFLEVYLSNPSDPTSFTTKMLNSEVESGMGFTLVPPSVEGSTQCVLIDQTKEWAEDLFAPTYWKFRVTVNPAEGSPIVFNVVGNIRNGLILEANTQAQIPPNTQVSYSLWMDQHFWDGEDGEGEAQGVGLRDSTYRFSQIVGYRLPEQHTAEGYYEIGTVIPGTHFSIDPPEGDRDTPRHHAPGFSWLPIAYDASEKGESGVTRYEYFDIGQKWSLSLSACPLWYQKALYAAILRNKRLHEAFCIVFDRSDPSSMRFVRVGGEPGSKNEGLNYTTVTLDLDEVRP